MVRTVQSVGSLNISDYLLLYFTFFLAYTETLIHCMNVYDIMFIFML